MNKEQYTHMRNSNQYDMSLFYAHYYKNTKSKPLPFEIFSQAFTFYFQANSESVFNKLDPIFGVSILVGKNNEVLKVI